MRTVTCLLLPCARLVASSNNGAARRPPMGWRSWEAFYGNVNQPQIEEIMDAMVNASRGKSLLQLGYSNVGLDDYWQACGTGANGSFHDSDGNPLVNKSRFPDLGKMVKHAHDLGLTAGWYMNNCGCAEHQFKELAIIDKIYKRSVEAFVKYDFDALKIDSCSQFNDMDKWAALLNVSATRPVELENCHQGGLVPGQQMPGQTCLESEEGALECPYNIFRVSDDIYNHWSFVINNINAMVPYLDDGSGRFPHSHPGQWAYADMLEIGQLSKPAASGWTPEDMVEDRAMFGLWCITSSPLILSFDVRNSANLDRVWPVLANEEAIAINQAWSGSPGMLVGTYNVIHHSDWKPGSVEQPQPVNLDAFRQFPGEIGMARGWSGVPADFAKGPHYMVLKVDESTSLELAEEWCASNATCAGFYYASDVASNKQRTKVWYKDSTQAFWMDGADHIRWTSRVKSARAAPFLRNAQPRASDIAVDTCFGQQVWAKRLEGGAFAVLLVNVGQPTLQSFELPMSSLLQAIAQELATLPRSFAVRDVWMHEDLPDVLASSSLHFESVAGHDSRFLLLTPKTMAFEIIL